MRENLNDYLMPFFGIFIQMPKEYRKRHLQRLEKIIRHQRTEISLMQKEYRELMGYCAFLHNKLKDYEHSANIVDLSNILRQPYK